MTTVSERPEGGETATEAGAPAVELRGVTKRFGETLAVDDVTLTVGENQFYALLGPSGCGKTTTLRMIGGFEEPTAGVVLLHGSEVTGLKPYKRPVNTVFQSYALFPHLNVFDNVAFGLRRQKEVKGKELADQVQSMLDLVQLPGMENRRPAHLSGGQRQRVALARALINHPKVLLLDEPLGALDLKLRKEMQIELKRIQGEVGITFIHVTHDQEEAMTMADTIAVMKAGRIDRLGSPTEIYEDPRTAFVASFLGASNLMSVAVSDRGTVATEDGTVLHVDPERLAGGEADLQVGVRPEKIRLYEPAQAGELTNALAGHVTDASFIGVSTHYRVETKAAGEILVVIQNDGGRRYAPGESVLLGWAPEHTFVVSG